MWVINDYTDDDKTMYEVGYYKIIGMFSGGGHQELQVYKEFDNAEDAERLCHYLNGGN